MLTTLQERMGAKVVIDPAVLQTHGQDRNYPQISPPQAVVFAESVLDVQEALRWAREAGVAVIPYGAGSSLEGQLIPVGPTLSLDLSRMKRILSVRPEDFLVEVEPGLTREELNAALAEQGLFFPVDPGANATLGGMASTNASGTTTVRYGGMRHNVALIDVVLASGEVLTLGRAVRKTSSGYDLKDLFLGSAGTLGIITRLMLRVYPLPAFAHTLRVFFPGLREASQASYRIMASGLPVARLELLDELSIGLINRDLGRDYPERPALFVEFHSSNAGAIAEESRLAEQLMRAAGALDVATASSPEERTAQWEARHNFYWAMVHAYPGCFCYGTDTAVPLACVTELVLYAQQLLVEMNLPGCIVGHVGDGNFHTTIAITPDQWEQAEAYSSRLTGRALELGGTASGEHGIGLVKKRFMREEHGAAVDWMQQIKNLFDPHNLLNPGKIF
ncbi:MAG TPA: FAD-binding oxidoreductase [Ktedonobacteraceae bacterium]|jgi:D-lactate dehydrogenase (cytochrome)